MMNTLNTTNKPCLSDENASAVPIVFENYMKVAKVNVITGEYRFIKSYQENRDKTVPRGDTIFDYVRRSLEMGIIHPDDSEMVLKYVDPEYLAERLTRSTGGKRIMIHGLRYRILGEYEIVSVEIYASRNFSKNNPWVVFCVKATDRSCSVIGSKFGLSSHYCKIIYADLKSTFYEPVFMFDSEIGSEESLTPRLCDWFRLFAHREKVFHEDMESFERYTDLESIRSWFRENDGEYSFSFRRFIGGEYMPVRMKIKKSHSYSEENPTVYIYVCSDDTTGEHEAERRAIEDYYSSRDIMTGMWNRSCFQAVCRTYPDYYMKRSLGVLTADLYEDASNDGDRDLVIKQSVRTFALCMIDTFGRDKCFRLGEKEFAVLSFGGDGESFNRRAYRFYKRAKCSECGSASIAYIRDPISRTVEEVLEKARDRMYFTHDFSER